MIARMVARLTAWRQFPHQDPWPLDELDRLKVATKAVIRRDRRQRRRGTQRRRGGVPC